MHGDDIPNLRPDFRNPVRPFRRPLSVDKDCVIALIPSFGSKWMDHSKNSNDATLTGASWSGGGRSGPALFFAALGDYLVISDDASLEISDNVTWEFWVYLKSVAGQNGLAEKYSTVGALRSWRVKVQVGMVRLAISSDGTANNSQLSALCLAANEWQHVVVWFSGGDWGVFINGIPCATPTPITEVSIADVSTDINVGKYGVDCLNGYMDEFRMYSRVLNVSEAMALYRAGKI